MKTKLTLLFALMLLLSGCEWLKKAGEVTISTNLTTDIPVVVAPEKSADLISEVNAVFSGTEKLSLADNPDIEDYLEKIREVDLKSVVITVNGLSAGQTIHTITVAVTGSGELGTQTNITSTNNSFTPEVNTTVYNKAEAALLANKEITITVSGNASGPMILTVHIDFTTDVVAGALD